jgi:nucleoside phosphorylase
MIYILVALKAEAQAFIDKYKLNKSKSNDNITLVVSGIGSKNMYASTKKVVDMMQEDDTILNVGICGASKEYAVGELIDGFETKIECVDEKVDEQSRCRVVDMESKGFLEASKNIKKRYMFKVVSDNFEPHKVTKDMAKMLIFHKIDDIMQRLKDQSSLSR